MDATKSVYFFSIFLRSSVSAPSYLALLGDLRFLGFDLEVVDNLLPPSASDTYPRMSGLLFVDAFMS